MNMKKSKNQRRNEFIKRKEFLDRVKYKKNIEKSDKTDSSIKLQEAPSIMAQRRIYRELRGKIGKKDIGEEFDR